jgi:hypothetical protein
VELNIRVLDIPGSGGVLLVSAVETAVKLELFHIVIVLEIVLVLVQSEDGRHEVEFLVICMISEPDRPPY